MMRTILTCAATVMLAGCAGPGPSADDASAETRPADERFVDDFRSERYEDALKAASSALAADPGDGMAHLYRASALTMLERHEEGAESFRRAQHLLPASFADATAFYLRALSLYQLRAYGQSMRVLDMLAEAFPHSRLAERGQELAAKTQERLASGASRENLNWYLDRGLSMQRSARAALAVEYLEEYLSLAGPSGTEGEGRMASARLTLGASYLELAAPAEAVAHLKLVDASLNDYRAGLFLALALVSTGDTQGAAAALDSVAAGSTDESVGARARAMRATLPEGNAP